MKVFNSLKDVFISSIPLLAIIIIVCGFVSPFQTPGEYVRLFVSYAATIIGLTLFLVGLDNSILPIGKLVGGSLIKLKKVAYIIIFGFVFGLVATVAEPALSVMAMQANNIGPQINNTLFVWLLGAGIGVATAVALWRVLKDINIKWVFFAFYVAVFIMAFFVPKQYIALAFDGSGATTGDVSVPFILTLGLGVAMTMSKSKTNEESFGIIGIASIGPIITVFIYGIILGPIETQPYTPGAETDIIKIIVNNIQGVSLALIPILVIFFVFQLFLIKLPKQKLIGILLSSLVVFIGLLIFLTGIDYGFAMAGEHIGRAFIDANRPWLLWLLLPLSFVLGFSITLSEPAVIVLGEQVEEISNGYINKKTIRLTLAIAIGLAALLCMVKILTENYVIESGVFLSDKYILWYLIPLYATALILLPFTPKLFVGLAFDSGGVVGGAIVSAFLTPLMLGTSKSLGQDILTSGFGMIAFISVTPLIVVQVLGIMYKRKQKLAKRIIKDEEVIEEVEVPDFEEQTAVLISELEALNDDGEAPASVSETPVEKDPAPDLTEPAEAIINDTETPKTDIADTEDIIEEPEMQDENKKTESDGAPTEEV